MSHPTIKIGGVYLFENPSAKSFVGRVTHIIDPFQVALSDAAWIANTGRYSDFCLKGNGGEHMEIEPCGTLPSVRWQNVVEWNFALFKEAV